MGLISSIIQKLNPAQEDIYFQEGENKPTTQNRKYTVTKAYETIEVVNRGVNLLVDSTAALTIDLKEKVNTLATSDVDIRPKRLEILLNRRPNPYISALTFKKNIFMDVLLEGNAFIYFDGAYLYQLPAINVEIITDKLTYINHYKYNDKKFYPYEIIHLKENSSRSIYRGDSRLKSCLGSIDSLLAMENYQTKYFQNNTILGLVLKTPNALSQKVKDRYINIFMQQHNASQGKRPVLLDGDMSIESLGNEKFRELDFQSSTTAQENQILAAIGIPPILLNSGNNANISPNQKLFYINTVLPLFNMLVNELELFFGYDMKTVEAEVLALQGEMKDKGNYFSTLVNNGIMTQNEAREQLRLDPSTDVDTDALIKPANVAGSASDSDQGGAPKKPKEDKE